MALLDQDPGPYNQTRGVMPTEPADRLPPSGHWLVFGPTFIVAVEASNFDQARALVLVKLGYTFRPWLADGLDARPATAAESRYVCQRKRTKPFRLTSKTPSHVRGAVLLVSKMLAHADFRSSGEKLTDPERSAFPNHAHGRGRLRQNPYPTR